MDNADKQAREILNIITNDLIGGDVENIYDVPTQEKNTSVIAQALREKDVLIKELQEDVSSWKRTASDCASDSRKMKKDKDDELAWWHELAQREIKGKVTSLPDYIKSLNVEIERLKFAIKINDDEREACAKVIDTWHIKKGGFSSLAQAIRSRT